MTFMLDAVEAQRCEEREGDAKMTERVHVPDSIESLATAVVDSCLEVHRALGPGLLESAYRDCLALELQSRGLSVEREKSADLNYRDNRIPNAYRVDLMVEQKLLLELKAVEAIQPVHRVQLNTYLKLQKLPLGLLINFNVPLIKNGITRVLNLDFRQ